MNEIRLITLDPGHFHAALVQKEMYPGVSKRVHIYAPLGADLAGHLNRIILFNTRAQNPASWELEVHTGPDYLERMATERAGNVAVLSGRNRVKIDYISSSISAGLNVLADKPWIIRSEDLPRLDAALETAERNGLVAYDIMTERYEITSILQRELVNDPEVFGSIVPGSVEEPAVYMESAHHLLKLVAGAPLLRPAWYFDILQQGEALADVGTHLVDLAQWTLFPGQATDWRRDVALFAARRWPTVIDETRFRQVTGMPSFPEFLSAWVKNGGLEYFCNTGVSYSLRGVHVKLDVLWNWQAPSGVGDTHVAIYRGSRARVEVRQGAAEKYRPELFVVPAAGRKAAVAASLRNRVSALAKPYPGVGLEERGDEFLVTIPESYRVGHEAHFAQVALQFFEYLKNPQSIPAWERANMMTKYYICTKGVDLSRQTAAKA